MTKRRFGPKYYFYWRREARSLDDDDSSLREITSFDERSAQQFLFQFKDDSCAMSGLRGLLSDSRRRIEVFRLTGDRVLAEVANLILTGELRVAVGLRWDSGGSGSTEQPKQPEPMPAETSARTTTRSEEPEPATFPFGLNGAAQAATLSAAAASGAAFCPH